MRSNDPSVSHAQRLAFFARLPESRSPPAVADRYHNDLLGTNSAVRSSSSASRKRRIGVISADSRSPKARRRYHALAVPSSYASVRR
jgi:hypothetical protein